MTILLTGSEGLIGTAVARELTEHGDAPRPFDLRARSHGARGDIRCADDVERAAAGCRGIIHLAAVSRVVTAERNPELCESTNVGGLKNVLAAAFAAPKRPWVLFVSSREVYGEQDRLPVKETAPLQPMNVYARSKVAGETAVGEASRAGLRTAVVRLSSVFGSVDDHAERVVPRFLRDALADNTLAVEGVERCFDFTYVDDVSRGITAVVDALDSGERLPPIHFVSGVATTLRCLAERCIAVAGSSSSWRESAPRLYDVGRFCGDPTLARSALGWRTSTSLDEGLSRLCADLRKLDVEAA